MTTTRPTAAQILQRCIARCAKSRDGRGRWRAERDCAAELGGRRLDADCAAAARRIGEWLRCVQTGASVWPDAAAPKEEVRDAA